MHTHMHSSEDVIVRPGLYIFNDILPDTGIVPVPGIQYMVIFKAKCPTGGQYLLDSLKYVILLAWRFSDLSSYRLSRRPHVNG
jgi:hypothetical protein